MAPSRKQSNGRSPLVNPQRQITSFFSKLTSPSPSPDPALSKGQTPKSNPSPNSKSPCPSPSPNTPSPLHSKTKKPLLVIGQSPSPSPSPSTPITATKSYGKEVVDKRIKVYWPLDNSWYEGCVKSYDEDSGKHLVQYDDFEEEVLDLGKEKIEWIEETVKKFKRLRRGSLSFKKTVIDDEDEKMKDVGGIEEDDNACGDDSSDEDWGNHSQKNIGNDEDDDIDLDDEEEEDNAIGGKKGKRGGKSESRKRKTVGAVKLDSGKKSKTGDDMSKGDFKVSIVEPLKNKGSKFSIGLLF